MQQKEEMMDSTVDELLEIAFGNYRAQTLFTAAHYDLANHIGKDEKKSVNDIAKELDLHAPTLYRLMRCLSNIRCFREVDESDEGCPVPFEHGVFYHTPLSLTLARQNIRDNILQRTGFSNNRCWESLPETLKTGVADPTKTLGYSSFWEYIDHHKEDAGIFNRAMTSYSTMGAPIIVASTDFSTTSSICDVGGGQGLLLKTILKANPSIKSGYNFDMPSVISSNKHADDLDARYQDIAGDFFESVPSCDTYTLKYILHDWNDEKSIMILKSIANSILPNGKVIIFDRVNSIHLKNENNRVPWMDLYIMQMCNGKQRSEEEWTDISNQAGFDVVSIQHPPKDTYSFVPAAITLMLKGNINGKPGLRIKVNISAKNMITLDPQENATIHYQVGDVINNTRRYFFKGLMHSDGKGPGTACEDAHFMSADFTTIGVADGVGSWRQVGVDSGEYSRSLMKHACQLANQSPTSRPLQLIDSAFRSSQSIQGSSTVCILKLIGNKMYSGLVVIGTDGFFDNVFDEEVLNAIRSVDSLERFFTHLRELAKRKSGDPNCTTPIGVRVNHKGGKPDDITVGCFIVSPVP
eukprot:gene13719-16173_t